MHLLSISSYFFNPAIFLLCETLLFILILGFTAPNSILRPAVVPLVVACAPKLATIGPTLLRPIWSGWCCVFIAIHLAHYIESALIVKWSFETQNPTSSAGPQDSSAKHKDRREFATATQTHGGTFRERFRFGCCVFLSYRNVGTPYMVKGTPEFSTKDPNYVPSRRAYLLRGATLIMIVILTLDLASHTTQPLEYNKVAFSVEAVPIFRGSRENLTIEKLVLRSATVLGYWVRLYLFLDGILSLFPLIHVALGIEDVRAYRPNFGPVREAYSVRQFWSVFWHQNLRKCCSAPVGLVVYKILRLRPGALLTRYLHLSLVFLVSGLLHEYMDTAQGFPRPYASTLNFFLTQAVGIMLEDAVQAIYHAIRGVPRGSPPTPMARAVGYVWLALFLCWSTPLWIYPQMAARTGEQSDSLLPFSLLSLLKQD